MDRAALRLRVAGHQPADEAEAAHQRAVLNLLDTTSEPFSRRNTAPGHITASAFVLSPSAGELLLIHHTFLGRWLQPGGHVELDDPDIDAACLREVVEETGVADLERLGGFPDLLDLDVHEIPLNDRRGEAAHKHFDVRTLWRARHDRLMDTGEVSGVRWVPLVDVVRGLGDASVTRAAARILARLGGHGA